MEAIPQIHMLGDPEMEIEDQMLAYFQQTLADLREMGGSHPQSVFYVSQKESSDARRGHRQHEYKYFVVMTPMFTISAS